MSPRVHFTRRTVVLFRVDSAPYAANKLTGDNVGVMAACDKYGVLYTRAAPSGPAGRGPIPISQFATSAPALGVAASASVPAIPPALPGINVASTLSWSWGDTVAVAAFISLVLRDGASGVGPILWQKTLGPFPAGTMIAGDITFSDAGAPFGSSNTAMTLEFLTAPSATGRQSVSITARGAT